MKKMKFNTVAARLVVAGCVVGLFMAAQAASACTLQNWSASSGSVAPGGPNPDTANGEVLSARYSGLCAMAASGEGFVEDTSPGGIDRIRARFYVLANNTEPAVVYEGFNGTTSIFTVAIDASGTVSLSGDGLSQAVTANGVSGNWNSIELDWDAGAGQASLWVNSDASSSAPDGSDNLTSGQVVTSVKLGNLDGAAGTMNFDAYESRRATPVGRLCEGDANSDGVRDFVDIGDIFIESATGGNTPANGNPDFNDDGRVDFVDIGEVFILTATGQGDCT